MALQRTQIIAITLIRDSKNNEGGDKGPRLFYTRRMWLRFTPGEYTRFHGLRPWFASQTKKQGRFCQPCLFIKFLADFPRYMAISISTIECVYRVSVLDDGQVTVNSYKVSSIRVQIGKFTDCHSVTVDFAIFQHIT